MLDDNCVRDSDPLGQDSRQSCSAVYGSEASFYVVGRGNEVNRATHKI